MSEGFYWVCPECGATRPDPNPNADRWRCDGLSNDQAEHEPVDMVRTAVTLRTTEQSPEQPS